MEDLELLAGVFELTDEKPIPRSLSVSGLRIAFARTHVWPKAGSGLKAAWKNAMMQLTRHGAEIEEIELPGDFAKLSEWHTTIVAAESRAAFLGSKLTLPSPFCLGFLVTLTRLLARKRQINQSGY